jgi:5'-3' exoribonuclease 2
MGVPGFFLWLLKKYKGTNFIFSKSKLINTNNTELLEQVKNLDYLLIDTNCLIHPVCFKILSDYPKLTNNDKLESKMINATIEYIEKLINYVQPKKGIYIAIDGVAPVAKIKQQRYRRFKSVYDRDLYNNIKRKHNIEIPHFWNNSAITPGTEFMRKLHNYIINWCSNYSKINKLEIIYSSCNVPSEGEHKLLQFIRNNQKNNINYSYVMYGLDADLIFLTLSTGIDDIFLLREAKQIDNKNKTDELNYVYIKTMRQCIYDTFRENINIDRDININIDRDIYINIDKNRIVDDFIFICYLMGNDFLPHLPSLNIYDGGIDYLINKYVEVYLENYEYIINKNEKEKINQNIFNKFIIKLANNEESILKLNYETKPKKFKCQSEEAYDIEIHKIENLMFNIDDPIMIGSDNMIDWRVRYYKHYYFLEPDEINNFSKKMVLNYLEGLKWVSEYYFDECPSWNWYYKYDHPPFLYDIVQNIENFDKIKFDKIKFNKNEPLKPFEQLLCVLPKQSAYLLPQCLRKIMLNLNSSLIHLYPNNFQLDMIGKKKFWMCMPILPSLEIDNIIHSFKKYENKLNNIEREMNKTDDIIIFK